MEYSYEFTQIRPKQLFVQVRYFKEDHPDIFKNIIVKEITEEAIKGAAEAYASEVLETWGHMEAAPEALELSSTVHSAVFVPPEDTDPVFVETIQDPEPEFDFYTQTIVPTFEETETTATHGWDVVDLNDEQRAERLVLGASQIRSMRDYKLSRTDHWLAADTPEITQAQLNYRQELRDVTGQPEFPKQIVWPELIEDASNVPSKISMRQCRLSLLSQGLLGQIEAAIERMDEPIKSAASIEWQYGSIVRRNSPLVLNIGAALGLDDTDLDKLFLVAVEL